MSIDRVETELNIHFAALDIQSIQKAAVNILYVIPFVISD